MFKKNVLSIKIIELAPVMKYRVEHTPDGDMIVHKKDKKDWRDHSIMKVEITINSYLTKFFSSLEIWDKGDYLKQWSEGLARISTYDKSCIVATIDNDRTGEPFLRWWLLYRVNGRICMQHHLLMGDLYTEVIGDNPFTPETCYDFIPSRQTHEDDGEKISEWVVGSDNFN